MSKIKTRQTSPPRRQSNRSPTRQMPLKLTKPHRASPAGALAQLQRPRCPAARSALLPRHCLIPAVTTPTPWAAQTTLVTYRAPSPLIPDIMAQRRRTLFWRFRKSLCFLPCCAQIRGCLISAQRRSRRCPFRNESTSRARHRRRCPIRPRTRHSTPELERLLLATTPR